MVTEGLDWDTELDGDLLLMSQEVLEEMLLAGEVAFHRGIVPEGADLADIGLVGFSDGGDPASAACLYVRTTGSEPGDEGKTHTVRLLAAKARVTPSSSKDSNLRASTPRTELRGMIYLTRLITALLAGFPYKPAYIFLATDSECTISAVEAEDKVLQAWFTNRVAEITDHLDDWAWKEIFVEPIHHWPGLTNVADLATKGKATIADIGEGSTWQSRSKELSYPRTQWPASRDFKRSLPDSEVRLRQKAECQAVAGGSWYEGQLATLLRVPVGDPSGAERSQGLATRRDTNSKWPQVEKVKKDLVNEWIESCKVRVTQCLAYSNELDKCLRILARVVAGLDCESRQEV